MMKNKPIDHPKLGGKVVDLRKPLPVKKVTKTLTGIEMLRKGMTGSSKVKVDRSWEGK